MSKSRQRDKLEYRDWRRGTGCQPVILRCTNQCAPNPRAGSPCHAIRNRGIRDKAELKFGRSREEGEGGEYFPRGRATGATRIVSVARMRAGKEGAFSNLAAGCRCWRCGARASRRVGTWAGSPCYENPRAGSPCYGGRVPACRGVACDARARGCDCDWKTARNTNRASQATPLLGEMAPLTLGLRRGFPGYFAGGVIMLARVLLAGTLSGAVASGLISVVRRSIWPLASVVTGIFIVVLAPGASQGSV